MIIQLNWDNLRYEIDQETWKGAKVRITGDERAEILNEAQTSSGIDVFDKNYCYRKIEQGLMNLQDIMHKFFVGYVRQSGKKLHIGDIVEHSPTQSGIPSKYYVTAINTSANPVTYTITPVEGGGAAISGKTIDELTFVSGIEADNALDNTSTWWNVELEFDARRNINPTLLASQMHKYVVLNVLQEWSKMAIPEMAQDYYNRLTIEANRLRAIVYRKETPTLN